MTTAYIATVREDGRILGLSSCHVSVAATHLARTSGTVQICQEEARKFRHGTPMRLVDGKIVADGPTLDEAKSDHGMALRRQCAKGITGGFSSSALGLPHIYPASMTDQINLLTAALVGMTANLWCADQNRVWALREHAPPQIKQVLMDAHAAVQMSQTRLAAALARVAAATTPGEVDAVTW